MIYGPPGIGKTSTVKVIAKELGYQLLEINANDNRSRKVVEGVLRDLC